MPQSYLAVVALAIPVALAPMSAAADEFTAGSLIIPMDTTYQDMGMLRAYGLVYALLQANVPVHWVIKEGKGYGDVDFIATSVDLASDVEIPNHGYRGGPWVIAAEDAGAAMPVVTAWQQANPAVAVHEALAGFSGDVSHLLVIAPTIAMMADGNQKIARKYMIAAGIPDSTGNLNWPDNSPDMLDPEELSGPTDASHRDGALFDADGDPVYCQFMSMHWGVGDAAQNPQVVAEMREFLTHPTHFYAQCQAVNAFENLLPHGLFLTQSGFLIGDKPDDYDFYQTDTAYGQLDGPFVSVGGSEPAYSLKPGDSYKATDIVMITEAGSEIGVNDVWMTGFLDGVCPASSKGCLTAGKVSYLGGHEYSDKLPISQNPETQGTRLFLNSLFEAPCATPEGAPDVLLEKTAPATTDVPTVDFTLSFVNHGATTALDAVLTDALAPGVTFVSATDDGIFADGVVTWELGNLGEGEAGSVALTVTFDAPGVYLNTAELNYRAGVNLLSVASNQTMTAYGVDPEDTDASGTTEPTGGGETQTGSGSEGEVSSDSDSGPTAGGATESGSIPTEGSASSPTSASDSVGDSAGMTGEGGCGCQSGDSRDVGGLWLMLLGSGLAVRRRSAHEARKSL